MSGLSGLSGPSNKQSDTTSSTKTKLLSQADLEDRVKEQKLKLAEDFFRESKVNLSDLRFFNLRDVVQLGFIVILEKLGNSCPKSHQISALINLIAQILIHPEKWDVNRRAQLFEKFNALLPQCTLQASEKDKLSTYIKAFNALSALRSFTSQQPLEPSPSTLANRETAITYQVKLINKLSRLLFPIWRENVTQLKQLYEMIIKNAEAFPKDFSSSLESKEDKKALNLWAQDTNAILNKQLRYLSYYTTCRMSEVERKSRHLSTNLTNLICRVEDFIELGQRFRRRFKNCFDPIYAELSVSEKYAALAGMGTESPKLLKAICHKLYGCTAELICELAQRLYIVFEAAFKDNVALAKRSRDSMQMESLAVLGKILSHFLKYHRDSLYSMTSIRENSRKEIEQLIQVFPFIEGRAVLTALFQESVNFNAEFEKRWRAVILKETGNANLLRTLPLPIAPLEAVLEDISDSIKKVFTHPVHDWHTSDGLFWDSFHGMLCFFVTTCIEQGQRITKRALDQDPLLYDSFHKRIRKHLSALLPNLDTQKVNPAEALSGTRINLATSPIYLLASSVFSLMQKTRKGIPYTATDEDVEGWLYSIDVAPLEDYVQPAPKQIHSEATVIENEDTPPSSAVSFTISPTALNLYTCTATKHLFAFRQLLQQKSPYPRHLVLPSQMAQSRTSPRQIALYQQRLALDCWQVVTEMVKKCSQGVRGVALRYFHFYAHQGIEQGITAVQQQHSKNAKLTHSISELASQTKISLEHAQSVKEHDWGTFYLRYPSSYPLQIAHLEQLTNSSLEEVNKYLNTMLSESLKIQEEALLRSSIVKESDLEIYRKMVTGVEATQTESASKEVLLPPINHPKLNKLRESLNAKSMAIEAQIVVLREQIQKSDKYATQVMKKKLI